MAKVDRSRYRGLDTQQKYQYDHKDDSGRFKSIFKDGVDAKFWKLTDGEHQINIIPFFAGKRNPNLAPGKEAYVLDLWTHRGIGPAEATYVCPARTWKKPCPICEYQNSLRKMEDFNEEEVYQNSLRKMEDFNEEEVKKLNPSRRAIYNVVVLDNDKEISKGVQIWDTTFAKFATELEAVSKKPRGGGWVLYPRPEKDVGKVVSFEVSGARTRGINFKAFQFIDRDATTEVTDEQLLGAYCLDDLITYASYEEIRKAFYQEEEGASTEEEGAVEAQASEDDVRDFSEEGSGEEGEGEEGSGEGEDAGSEAAEENLPPVTAKPKFKCPVGATFGEDFDTLENCDGCRVRIRCEEEYKVLHPPAPKAAPKPAPKPAPAPAPKPAPAPANKPLLRKRT